MKKKISEAVGDEPKTSSKDIDVPAVISQKKELSVDKVNSVNPSQSKHKNLSTAQAAKKLRRKLRIRGENVELKPKLNSSIMALEDLESAKEFKECEIMNPDKKSLETVDLMVIEDESQEEVSVDEVNDLIDKESQGAVADENPNTIPILVLDTNDEKHVKKPALIENYSDSKVDDQVLLEIPFPALHFSKRLWGDLR